MSEHQIQCTGCGARVDDGSSFCHHCGEAIDYAPPQVDPFIGRVVSQHYKVIERIARGGMGEVYLARHAELNQRVAVKFLHRRFADDEEFAARFFNEARSACRVNHPNAVSIYDFARLDDGTLYIVMEFVEGISLKQLIQRDGRVGLKTALRVAQQAADVLSAAHRQSIIHRDVKPDNIMVLESPSGRVSIKMLDFGIAKILDDDSAMGSLTQTGVTFGTPEYMSPEQAAGREVDERSDIYSLCLVLFAMLSGEPPFRGKNKLALLQRHIREPAPALDRAAGIPIPAELAELVASGLEKDAARRPRNMDALATRLEEIERASGVTSTGARIAPGVSTSTTMPSRPVAASAKRSGLQSNNRVLTHSPSEPIAMGDVGPEATEAYELGSEPSASEEAFELGDSVGAVEAEGYSLGADQEDAYSFDDDPYAAPLRPTGTPGGGGRKVAVGVSLALVIAAIILLARLLGGPDATRPTEAEGSGDTTEALAAADAGEVSPDEEIGAAVAAVADAAEPNVPAPTPDRDRPRDRDDRPSRDEPTRPPDPPAEPPAADPPAADIDDRVGAVRAAIESGDRTEARSLLDALSADGHGDAQGVRAETDRLDALDALVATAERELRSGNCLRADEQIVAMQERYSRALAMTYWGRLDACRAAAQASSNPAPVSNPNVEPDAPAPSTPPRDLGGGGTARAPTPAPAPRPEPEPETDPAPTRPPPSLLPRDL